MIPTNFEPTALFTMELTVSPLYMLISVKWDNMLTAFAQIIAEELLDWKDIKIDYPGWPDNIQKLGVHFTADPQVFLNILMNCHEQVLQVE